MRLIGNVLWLLLAGIWLALTYVVAGILMFLTIIGIPFGVQAFKLAGYALWPFGRVVVENPRSDRGVSFLANIIWIVLAGLWLAIEHLLLGILLCITIIGIPFGVASFKMAILAIAPFGKEIIPARSLPADVTIAHAPPGAPTTSA